MPVSPILPRFLLFLLLSTRKEDIYWLHISNAFIHCQVELLNLVLFIDDDDYDDGTQEIDCR